MRFVDRPSHFLAQSVRVDWGSSESMQQKASLVALATRWRGSLPASRPRFSDINHSNNYQHARESLHREEESHRAQPTHV